jgi:peptidoglycan hydrolase CwlO-like protein
MLHNHSTGAIQIITWEEIKTFIRAIATLSGINISMNITSDIEKGLLKQKADNLANQLQSYKDKNDNLKAQLEGLKKGEATLQSQIHVQKNRIEELKQELEETTEDLDTTYKNWRELYEATLHHPIHTWLTLKSKEKEKNK